MKFEDLKQKISYALVIGTLLFFLIAHITKNESPVTLMAEIEEATITSLEMTTTTEVLDEIYVDIKGEVVTPGVYRLNHESRLLDVIELAGGLTAEADMNQINQALLLTDQMMIVIPNKNQVEKLSNDLTNESSFGIMNPLTQLDHSLVNLNSATLEELQTLTGIGPKKAEAIVSYRQEMGSFQSIEDLLKVTGIGQKTFDQLKDEVTVSR